MKMQTFGKMPSAAILIVALSGCATHQQIAKIQYQRFLYENQFLATQQSCLAAGGTMVISASQGLGRKGVPVPGDRYFCQ